MQYPPTTLPAAIGRLEGAHNALRLAIEEISDRDARIEALEAELRSTRAIAAHAAMLQWRCTALEAAIREALRLYRAGCGDAYKALTTALGAPQEQTT
jgi:hypothetical protein